MDFNQIKRFNYLNYPNWHNDGKDSFWYVKQIDFENKRISVSNGLFETRADFDNLKPIPLSLEWLKKAGYKQLRRIEKTYSLGNFEDNSSIYFTGVRFIHIQTGTHLEFIHEWQNLYSAIFKKELKFSL